MSAKYKMLKNRWDLGWITEETLRGWVEINERKPGKGITAEEFDATIKMFENSFCSYKDTIFSVMDFHIGQNLLGKNLGIDDFLDKIRAVCLEDVIRVSQNIVLDTVYFLTGDGKKEVEHETV